MADEKKFELEDIQLEDVAGGVNMDSSCERIYDKGGSLIGFKKDGLLYYWPCRLCGRPTHIETALGFRCDQCKRRYGRTEGRRWTDTEESLKYCAR